MIDKMSDELRDLLYRPNEDTIFMTDFNEDEVVHVELIGKRRVYSEAAYNKLLAKHDRLRDLLNCAVEWTRDRGYDDPETAPEWFLAALQEDSE